MQAVPLACFKKPKAWALPMQLPITAPLLPLPRVAQGVSGKENQDNPGRLNLMIDSHVQSARHQSSALTQNSIFPDTRNPSLNPDANVFVPRSFSGKGK
jgi:hypothetical protein